MKRTGFGVLTPKTRPRPTVAERAFGADRSNEFASYVAPVASARMAVLRATELTKAMPPKIIGRKATRTNNAIRESARGEDCTVRLPGICSFDPAKTIWSHAPFGSGGKARGLKAIDLAGAYCCTACDAAIDRQTALPPGMTREQAELDWFHGHLRSLVRLKERGLA